MNFRVYFSEFAYQQLNHLDDSSKVILLGWLNKNLEGTNAPRLLGQPLKNILFGHYKFVVGKFRLLILIEDKFLIVLKINRTK
ncbi:MAG: type II toxin-antitoxin system mRNA interferase toxin, RelE/StbE family [Erysipelotrichia bacterium]|nr:type II toxin-antitoxin system mRNA interferase toxin, RelE/StbE family [Erysipelotrichia bacterium]